MKHFILLFSVFALMISLSGCASRDPDIDKPAHELARNGMDEFEDEDNKRAIELFEKLRDWYPFSKYVKLAELKIADGHYHLEEYEDAIFAYEEFEELHPKNEAIPYVIYSKSISFLPKTIVYIKNCVVSDIESWLSKVKINKHSTESGLICYW